MAETLTGLPAPLVLIVAAVLLCAESGLVVGIVLPGAGLVLSLGLLSSLGVVGLVSTVLTATAATLLGSQFAFLSARHRDPAGFGLVGRRARPLLSWSSRFLARNPTALGWTSLLVGLGRLAGSALDQVRVAVGLPLVLLCLAIHHMRKGKYACATTSLPPTR